LIIAQEARGLDDLGCITIDLLLMQDLMLQKLRLLLSLSVRHKPLLLQLPLQILDFNWAPAALPDLPGIQQKTVVSQPPVEKDNSTVLHRRNV